MGRNRLVVEPTETPSELEWVWAGALFEHRARGVTQTLVFSVQMNFHIAEIATLEKLQKFFGGQVYVYPTVQRWRVIDAPRDRFLEGIRPYLTSDGLRKLNGMLAMRDAVRLAEDVKRAATERRLDELRVRNRVDEAPVPVSQDLFNLPSPFDDYIVSDSIPILIEPGTPMTCKAKTEDSAAEYAAAFHAAGFVVSRKGLMVAVALPPSGRPEPPPPTAAEAEAGEPSV